MNQQPSLPLLAVHISDGLLTGPWLIGGFIVAGLLIWLGAWRIRDEEIPQTAVMTAAFFVASLIHVRVLYTSVHLLLNGLVGVVLGRRAALAIPIGLFLQAVLIGHGGLTTLGVNSCVMALPALFAWQLFSLLGKVRGVRKPWFRALLTAISTSIWTLSIVYVGSLLMGGREGSSRWAAQITFHPLTLGVVLILSTLSAWLERRLENAPEFPLGLLIGESTVLLTVFLNCTVLAWGGEENWTTLAEWIFAAHLPIAVVEGLILGFTIGFLARVKPEMLGWTVEENPPCALKS
jgi:cobalt/nickel transport system permease protein